MVVFNYSLVHTLSFDLIWQHKITCNLKNSKQDTFTSLMTFGLSQQDKAEPDVTHTHALTHPITRSHSHLPHVRVFVLQLLYFTAVV